MDKKLIKSLKRHISTHNLQVEAIFKVSRAACNLMQWVLYCLDIATTQKIDQTDMRTIEATPKSPASSENIEQLIDIKEERKSIQQKIDDV